MGRRTSARPPALPPRPAQTTAPAWARWLPFVIIPGAGLGAYLNSLTIPFVWDDVPSIVDNATIRRLWPLPGPLAPPLETPMAGRPVANLSLALNYAMGGLQVEGYHWWNLGVHVACALLLSAIVRRTLLGPRLAPAFAPGAGAVALASAAIWMLHPLQTEAVDYVTQRTESMMGLFVLLTLYCAVRGCEASPGGWWHAAAVCACGLGMGAKASMAPAPLVVLLYDRALVSGSFKEALRQRRWLYAGLASSWVVLALLMWAAPRSTVGASDAVGASGYLLNQAEVVGRYLRLVVWPHGLVLDYGLPRTLSIGDVWPQVLVIGGLATAAAFAWHRSPAAGFAPVVGFLMLAPTSSVIPITSEVGAERRMYVPMMALVAWLVVVGWSGLERVRRQWPRASRALALTAAAIAVGLAALLAAATMARNATYGNPVALWRDVIAHRPHSRARLSLATALMDAGQGAEAIAELRLAVRDYPDAKYALGVSLQRSGQVDEAIDVLDEFIDDHHSPASGASLVPARLALANAYTSLKRFDQAASQYRAILAVAPRDRSAQEGLGDMLLSQSRYEAAVAAYESVMAEGSSPRLETKLGFALQGAHRIADAAMHFARALALDPRSADAHRSLAEIAWERGEVGRAVGHAEAALAIDPANAGTHDFLGAVLASSGRVGEAIPHFQEALRLEPSNASARDNLERARRDLSQRPQAPLR